MNDEFLAIFWLGISATVNLALVLAWFGLRRRLRRLETRPIDLSQLDDMMARVDSSLDGVTARLDELVSSQDFLNRVLADRLDRMGRALPPPAPHNTPV